MANKAPPFELSSSGSSAILRATSFSRAATVFLRSCIRATATLSLQVPLSPTDTAESAAAAAAALADLPPELKVPAAAVGAVRGLASRAAPKAVAGAARRWKRHYQHVVRF